LWSRDHAVSVTPTAVQLDMNASRRKVIVVVAMLDSSHVAKWLRSVAYQQYQIRLFPSSPHRRLHPDIARLIADQTSGVSLSSMLNVLALPLWVVDNIRFLRMRQRLLTRLCDAAQPDVLHAIEFQHSAYLAEPVVQNRPVTFYVTNYGSDLYWFGQQKKHRSRIDAVLRRANFYSAECQRDVELARSFGYKGKVFPVRPNAGGIPETLFDSIEVSQPSSRRVIAIKGYTNFVGLAQRALKAVVVRRKDLRHFKIVVYSATYRARLVVVWMRLRYQINIHSIPKFRMSQPEVVQMMSTAALYVGVSESDGLSTSMLEALSCGAFVIQSGTSCCVEVVEHGEGAYVLRNNSVQEIVGALDYFLSGVGDRWNRTGMSNAGRLRDMLKAEALAEHARNCYQACLAAH